MKVNPPSDAPKPKETDLGNKYLFIEHDPWDNSYIIIDDFGDIGGDAFYIDEDHDNTPWHWQVLEGAPRRHIRIWRDSGAVPIIKVVKLDDNLDWRPVDTPPAHMTEANKVTVSADQAGANLARPRIVISLDKVFGIEYDPAGANLRNKASRSRVQVSTLGAPDNDDFVYITFSGDNLHYFQKP